jgi:hypothetical protein
MGTGERRAKGKRRNQVAEAGLETRLDRPPSGGC